MLQLLWADSWGCAVWAAIRASTPVRCFQGSYPLVALKPCCQDVWRGRMGACRWVALRPCWGPHPHVMCAFRVVTLGACSRLMWGSSAAFYAGVEMVTRVGFPSRRREGRLRRAFRLAEHVMDVLWVHTQPIQKKRSLVLSVSAFSTSGLLLVLHFKVFASMHSLTKNDNFN